MAWALSLLARWGVGSPFLRGLILTFTAALAIGVAVLAVKAGVNAVLEAKYREGYAAAAAKCREAQLETRIASLLRDLDQARKQADREHDVTAALRADLHEANEENARYAEERIKLGAARCAADDPAVTHDRRLRERRQAPAGRDRG